MIGLSLLSSSVNIICGRHILCLLTDNNDNPIIIRPHIVFTDGRQQQQPNHNTITYCVYWRKTQYVVVLWLGCRSLPSINTICGRIMIGLSLLSSFQALAVMRNVIIIIAAVSKQQANHWQDVVSPCLYKSNNWHKSKRLI
jgi:hypothetical protein